MKIILGILILAFIGLYVILHTLRKFVRMFTGETPQQQRSHNRPKSTGGINTSTAKAKKKIISKDEGEYVDYEEIKNK